MFLRQKGNSLAGDVRSAEKFQPIVALGIANSRMKDFYDLWTLPKAVGIDMKDLADAILGTFERRNAVVPATCPVGLSAEYSAEPGKMTQWRAYSGGTAQEGKSLAEITADIWRWLEPSCKPAS